MSAWFNSVLSSDTEVTTTLGVRIATAFLLGGMVSLLYRWARRGESVQPTFLATLVLLAGLIAMATQIIGDNIARAFSLVGALSVVRFRTAVKDVQDTAFVIFAVVVGMSAGASHVLVGVIGLGVAALAAPFLWPPGRRDPWRRADGILSLRVGQIEGSQASVESYLANATTRFELFEAGTAKKGASRDLVYHIRLAPGESPTGLIAGLSQLPDVEDVGLRRRE